jgi:hypothetical protein
MTDDISDCIVYTTVRVEAAPVELNAGQKSRRLVSVTSAVSNDSARRALVRFAKEAVDEAVL